MYMFRLEHVNCLKNKQWYNVGIFIGKPAIRNLYNPVFCHMGYPDIQWVNIETTNIFHLLANDEINEA